MNSISEKKILTKISMEKNSQSEMQVKDLNCFITTLGCSLLKFHGAEKRNRIVMKRITVHKQVKSPLQKLPSSSICTVLDNGCKLVKDMMIFYFNGISKQKCATSYKLEALQLLTILPLSWSIQRIADVSEVYKYIVKTVHAMHYRRNKVF
jgi:hypothetical protein